MEGKKITISETELIELFSKFHKAGIVMGSIGNRDILFRSKSEFDKFRFNSLVKEQTSKLFKK